MPEEPSVVILGAGFAGLGVKRALNKAPVQVTLIDRNDYHTFLPLLYQVATGELSSDEVGFPNEEMIRHRPGWEFLQANVTEVDLANRRVLVDSMDPIPYDYIVVGLGAVANFFGTNGAAEHAFPLYSMRDAERLREHIGDRLAAAARDQAIIDDRALTLCVVGGGATGVEISGAIAELLDQVLKEDYPDLPADKAEVHVFELGPQLLGPFKPNLQKYAQKALE